MAYITILVRVQWPGGPQRIAINESNLLRQKGFNVDLVFIRETEKKVKEFDGITQRVIYNKEVSRRPLQKIFSIITKHYNNGRGEDATVDLDLIAKYELLKSKSSIVIYFDQFTALFSILRKIRGPFKKIVFIHETAFRENSPLKKMIERIALFNSDYIITNSYFNQKILNKNGYRKVAVVYPGIKLSSDILNFNARSNICIIVTVFEPWRKPELFLDIAKYLRDTKIVMAGQWADQTYKIEIENKIKSMNLTDKVIITGLVDESVLENVYKISKIALRFGFDEHGPGMGALEAIGYGIPLIVNSGIGITELLEKYNYDLICEDISPEKIARVIDKLATDKIYWDKYHNIIMNIAKENSWDKHIDILSSIIDKVISETL